VAGFVVYGLGGLPFVWLTVIGLTGCWPLWITKEDFASSYGDPKKTQQGIRWAAWIFITFLSLMGAFMDFGKNPLTRSAIEPLLCGRSGSLVVGALTTHPYPGATFTSFPHTCVDAARGTTRVPPFRKLATYMGVYLGAGSLFMLLGAVGSRVRRARQS
jgi:hypothetical protein